MPVQQGAVDSLDRRSTVALGGYGFLAFLTLLNVLNMLDLAGIPLWGRERGEGDPLVIAGGSGAFNPEPLAPFMTRSMIDGLDRFWRNVRTHTLHDPIDYKLRDLGRHALTGAFPEPTSYS